MSIFSWWTSLIALLLLGMSAVHAQEAASAPEFSTEDSATELQARWQYYGLVPIPAASTPTPADAPDGSPPPLVDLVLQPRVFSHARLDLADLRLFDSAGQTVPYALRFLRPGSDRDKVPAEEFNRSEPPDGPRELTLDLKRDDIQHNEIEIVTSGENFRRPVEAEGSDDGKLWRRLAVGHLIRFAYGEQKIKVQSITYPASRYRYLRVRVSPDPGPLDESREKDEFTVNEVNVLRRVDLPGEMLMLPGQLGQREPVRTYGTPGSAWIIELGGDRVPCDRIEIDVADAEFARDIQVEYELLDLRSRVVFESVLLVGQSLWQRRVGESKQPMVATFTEVQTSRLKLRVTDHRNPPLTIRSVKFGAPARQVVFARPSDEPGTLRLFFGNPRAEPPNYDFARNLPAKLTPPPVRVSLGEVEPNPDFVPPPKAFTERFPWLIYVVLGSVSVVLAAVIVSLSRTAIAIHDSVAADQL